MYRKFLATTFLFFNCLVYGGDSAQLDVLISPESQIDLLVNLRDNGRKPEELFPELTPVFKNNIALLSQAMEQDPSVTDGQRQDFKNISDKIHADLLNHPCSLVYLNLAHFLLVFSCDPIDNLIKPHLFANPDQLYLYKSGVYGMDRKTPEFISEATTYVQATKQKIINNFIQGGSLDSIFLELSIFTEKTKIIANLMMAMSGGYYCLPVVTSDGLIDIKTLNKSYANGIFPWGIPLNSLSSWDGRCNQRRMIFVWHDCFHIGMQESHMTAEAFDRSISRAKQQGWYIPGYVFECKNEELSRITLSHIQCWQKAMSLVYDIIKQETDIEFQKENELMFFILFHEVRKDYTSFLDSSRFFGFFGREFFLVLLDDVVDRKYSRTSRIIKELSKEDRDKMLDPQDFSNTTQDSYWNLFMDHFALLNCPNLGIPKWDALGNLNVAGVRERFISLYDKFVHRYPELEKITPQSCWPDKPSNT